MQTQLNMQAVEGWAKEVMLDVGEMEPMLWVEGEARVAMVSFPSGIGHTADERAASMYELGKMLSDKQSVGKLLKVYFVHEGWALDVKEGELPDHAPSEDPNRIEILMVAEYDALSFKTNIRISEIVRDEQEELLGLRDMRSGEAESNMIEAFVTGYETFRGKAQ